MTKDFKKKIWSVSETKGLFLLCTPEGEREKGQLKSFQEIMLQIS